jgi:hypothetical protein
VESSFRNRVALGSAVSVLVIVPSTQYCTRQSSAAACLLYILGTLSATMTGIMGFHEFVGSRQTILASHVFSFFSAQAVLFQGSLTDLPAGVGSWLPRQRMLRLSAVV